MSYKILFTVHRVHRLRTETGFIQRSDLRTSMLFDDMNDALEQVERMYDEGYLTYEDVAECYEVDGETHLPTSERRYAATPQFDWKGRRKPARWTLIRYD